MSVHLYQSPDCRPGTMSSSANDNTYPWCCPTFGTSNTNPAFTNSTCTDGYPPSEDIPDPRDEEMGDDETSFVVDDGLQDVVLFPHGYTTAQKHEAQLLKLIHSMGASNGSFQDIMSWAKNALASGYDFDPSPKAYERQIVHFEKLVGMKACRPSSVPVNMYRMDGLDDMLDVVVFDFPAMLASLFECPVLNKIENLVVNPHDRFSKYEAPNGLLGEVNSGLWYDTAYANLIEDPDKDFLCPIIFAMDKTVVSEASKLSVLVILFTSSVFNLEVSFSPCIPLYVHSGHVLYNVILRLETNPTLGVLWLIFLAKVSSTHKNSTKCFQRIPSNLGCFNCSRLG
jgi:hypothetical protein